MSNIKFARDFGYPPAAPFWLVWNEEGRPPVFKHQSRDEAEAEAARLAAGNHGRKFHVLAVMSTISTSADVVGERFDPTRVNVLPDVPECPPPAFITEPEDVL